MPAAKLQAQQPTPGGPPEHVPREFVGPVIRAMLGRLTWVSKRLAPPFGISNAKIWADGHPVWVTDLDLATWALPLARLAGLFATRISVTTEAGVLVWRSVDPDFWWLKIDYREPPLEFDDVAPELRRRAKVQAKQWMVEHALAPAFRKPRKKPGKKRVSR